VSASGAAASRPSSRRRRALPRSVAPRRPRRPSRRRPPRPPLYLDHLDRLYALELQRAPEPEASAAIVDDLRAIVRRRLDEAGLTPAREVGGWHLFDRPLPASLLDTLARDAGHVFARAEARLGARRPITATTGGRTMNETMANASADALARVIEPTSDAGAALLAECLAAVRAGGAIAWYPSAGRDYREVVELGAARRAIHGLEVGPTLIVRTTIGATGHGVLHDDGRTLVRATREARIAMRSDLVVNPFVRDAAFDRRFEGEPVGNPFVRDGAPREPRNATCGGYLLDVEATSKRFGTSRAWLLELDLSNYDFFLQFVAREGLRFQTLVRVREGLGMGGCQFATTHLVPWLAWAGCREIIPDQQLYPDAEALTRVRGWASRSGAPKSPPRFAFVRAGASFRWSELDVDPWRLEPREGTFATFTDVRETIPEPPERAPRG
jgi:hypothetical protein